MFLCRFCIKMHEYFYEIIIFRHVCYGFYIFLHFLRFYIFLHFYISLQGIAFAVKAPPATGFYSCSGGCCKIWDSTIADQYSNT